MDKVPHCCSQMHVWGSWTLYRRFHLSHELKSSRDLFMGHINQYLVYLTVKYNMRSCRNLLLTIRWVWSNTLQQWQWLNLICPIMKKMHCSLKEGQLRSWIPTVPAIASIGQHTSDLNIQQFTVSHKTWFLSWYGHYHDLQSWVWP